MQNWIVWNRTDYLHKMDLALNKGWYAIKPNKPNQIKQKERCPRSYNKQTNKQTKDNNNDNNNIYDNNKERYEQVPKGIFIICVSSKSDFIYLPWFNSECHIEGVPRKRKSFLLT